MKELEQISKTPREYCDVSMLFGEPSPREILSQGVAMLIPRQYLFGRQRNDSYSKRKRSLAENELKKDGIGFLYRNPIIVCGINTKAGMQMIVIDGHHRTRYSSAFNIREIPSIVYSPEQLINAFNQQHKLLYTTESLIGELERDVSETLDSFRTLSDEKQPKIFLGAFEPDKLPFVRFPFQCEK